MPNTYCRLISVRIWISYDKNHSLEKVEKPPIKGIMKMLNEIKIDLNRKRASIHPASDRVFGKSLAIERIIEADEPQDTIYLSGYTPLAASGLGFAGKLNVYGISILGGNIQGSRSGGLIASFLTRLGIAGIEITGRSNEQHILLIGEDGTPQLNPLEKYGTGIAGTSALARRLYQRHGERIAMAVTDPETTDFMYNAIACNSRHGGKPDRVAGRSTSRFGQNGLVGIVVEHAPQLLYEREFNRKALTETLRFVHRARCNPDLTGSSDRENPLLGGTYGAAAKARFDKGHGLTNLFRNAHVPEKFYETLLPEHIVGEQLELSEESGINITRHACLPGCPNRCIQVVLLRNKDGEIRAVKSGEWETYQGVINLGIFNDAARTAAEIIEHSNEYAYDHIEALVALAALALVTEIKTDTGIRYGDRESIIDALHQAVAGKSELGTLIRQGAAAIEQHYGIERHFTIGGHALPFHNGRSLLQTGIGLSWTYGRHGESCAGPGRHNFLGEPYDPSDHTLDARTHILNALHGMVLYGAADDQGMCFFIGPTVDTLIDSEMILKAMQMKADARQMVRNSAQTLLGVYEFNARRGVHIQPLPRIFYEQPTHGNKQNPDEAVAFSIPFEAIHDYGLQILRDIASGDVSIPDEILEASRYRYD
jgi:aldehyde:ferredoxin oxidoreductase